MQGEGPDVGRTTIFVRTGGCDLRCGWCDSPETWRPARDCRIEVAPGSARFESRPNPVPLEIAVEAVEALGLERHALVSLTGGEPLLQAQAVAELADALRGRGPRIHLETHGLAVDAIERVAPRVDVVSMDWKLTSDVRRASDPSHGSVPDFHDAHEKFLAAAHAATSVVVKVVLTPATRDAELDEVCRRIAARSTSIPLILQPVSPTGRVAQAPDGARLLAWTRRCGESIRDVRLIPQTHKIISVL